MDPKSHSSMSSSMGSGMSNTFFTSTQTPLWFNQRPSVGAYAGSCLALIVLAAVTRLLFAAKYRIESHWLDVHQNRRVLVANRPSEAMKVREHEEADDAFLRSESGVEEHVRVVKQSKRVPMPWRLSIDLPRAIIAVVLIGFSYMLMLAVMTYNVGYFFSVLAGHFIGELAVGRYLNTDEH